MLFRHPPQPENLMRAYMLIIVVSLILVTIISHTALPLILIPAKLIFKLLGG